MTENQEKEMFNLLTKSVNGLQELNKRFDTLEEKVGKVQKDVSGLKEDVSGLKNDVSGLKEGVSGLKEDVSVIKQDVSELKQGQERIEKEIRSNTLAIDKMISDQFKLKVRVKVLEKNSI